MAKKKAEKAVSNGHTVRDEKGRFGPGCKAGPGNPRLKKLPDYLKALRAAIKPKDVKAVFEKLLELALAGNLDAIREVNSRTLGKPTSPPPESSAVSLPALTSPESCIAGFTSIFNAMGNGEISVSEATQLSGIIELARRSLETVQIEQRLQLLEERNKDDGF